MNIKSMRNFIGLAGLTLVSQAALADYTITAKYNGSADFGDGGVGYGNGKIWPNPSHPGTPSKLESVGVGGDNFTTTDNYNFISDNGSFNTWCVDITHYLSTGTTVYTLGGRTQLNALFGTSRVDDLQALANQHYLGLNNKTSSAAFQLATWAILFGTPDSSGTYDLHSNTFKTSYGITGGTLAQSWLETLDTAANTGAFNMIYLYGSASRSQNLVVFAPVPEPSTYAMMLGGIGMLGWMTRKKAPGTQLGSLRFA